MVIKTKQKKIFKYNENGRENIYQQQSESKHSMIKIQTFHERVKWCKREEQCNHTKMHAATIPLKQMVYTTLRERKRVRDLREPKVKQGSERPFCLFITKMQIQQSVNSETWAKYKVKNTT